MTASYSQLDLNDTKDGKTTKTERRVQRRLCHPTEADCAAAMTTAHGLLKFPTRITNFLDWTQKDGTAGNDWRKLDLIFPEDKSK